MTRRSKFLALALLLTVVVLIGGVAAYPFIRGDMETIELNAAVRAKMPDKHFVTLSGGVTHYQWAGPRDGQRVVLIHGLTSPAFLWDRQFDPLAEAGFRVLRSDLFGRGYSDRPDVRYTAEFYQRQLRDLLDSQGVTEPVDLVGLSMGGAITVQFIDAYPERVRRFALFAPAGFPVPVPLKYRVIKWPGVGEWFMKAFGDPIIISGITERITEDPARQAAFETQYIEQMRYKGYKRALLSTLRHNPLLNLQNVYERVGRSGKAGILFWGTNDRVVSFDHHEHVRAAIPDIEFHVIDGAGHTSNYEVPDIVNPQLIAFLKR